MENYNKSKNKKTIQLFSYSAIQLQSGATLIELMAAVSIFTATLMVVITVLIAVISSQRRSVNAINIENAAYFAMETISKEIRMGKDFSCASGPVSNCDEIAFTNYRNEDVTYKLTTNINGKQIEKTCSPSCSAGFITPSTINAANLKFILNGIDQPDYKQSRITIVMQIETLAGIPESQKRDVKLQTTISSRQPDS